MIAKVILGTMNNARKLVSIVEKIPYDAELCSGRYVVNAKSMLGVLSMPEFEVGELHIHTDEEIRIRRLMENRSYTREKSVSIIASQAPETFFRENADYVVVNNGDFAQTRRQIEEGIRKYETL
mgnify:CR=1 FL=1